MPEDALARTGYLAPELLARMAAEREAMRGKPGGADLLLCAQDVPRQIEVASVAGLDEGVEVVLTSEFAGHGLRVRLAQRDGAWLVVDIRCVGEDIDQAQPAPIDDNPDPALALDPAREGWTLYANGRYGFDLSYPADWTHQELIDDPNQPPIGPEPVKVVTLLMPQAWADEMAKRQGPPDPNAPTIAPFTLEVIEGDETVLRQLYLEPTTQETLSMAGLSVTREVESISDEIHLVRHVVRHPERSDTWLVLTDAISGFPDRVSGNEAVLATLLEVLATLRAY